MLKKMKKMGECSGVIKKRLLDGMVREISSVLNLKFNWLADSTGLP